MIGKKVWTLTITSQKIIAARVDIKRKSINKSKIYDRLENDLLDKLTKLTKDHNIKNVKILLSDDLCNFWGILVPEDLEENEKYELIRSEVLKEHSGDPDSLIWDFVDADVIGKKRRIAVFFAKESILKILTKLVKTNDIVIETVEPESFSKLRHDNPIIGISLKNDLQPNLVQVSQVEPINITEVKQPEELSSKNKNRLIMIAKLIATILIALIIVGLVYVYQQRSFINKVDQPDQKVVNDDEITVDPTIASGLVVVEPSPSLTPLSNYGLSILNASGVDGGASRVGSIMRAQGFGVIQIGNADTQDNEITTIIYKSNIPKPVLNKIEEILEDYDLEFVEANDQTDQDIDIKILVGIRS